jgi:glycosyltransferase involved in cell wall biosynthesis
MSLKIVFFNRSFYPDITATSQLLTELCEDLVKDYDCRVTAVAGMPLKDYYPREYSKGKIIQRENFKGIEILRVKNTTFSPNFFLGRLSNYLTYFFLSFIASFRLTKPDLVITLTDPPIIGLVGLWVCRRFNIPLIISVRDIFPEAAKGLADFQSKIINFLLDCINRFCLKKADHIIALGNLMSKRLIDEKGINDHKISIISDWVDCAQIFPVSKENVFSVSHSLVDNFVIMYAGNIGASSGLEFVIKSAKLLKDYKDILFVFIGEGIIKDKLIKLVDKHTLKNTKFFPYQPKETLSYVFSSADIFILPLKKGLAGYSLPSKIYSILASGRPCIACVEEESEVAQIIQEFNCGLLSRPQDHQDLAEKILFLQKNKELRIRMGGNARNAAVFFDRPLGEKKYYELFRRLLKDKENL